MVFVSVFSLVFSFYFYLFGDIQLIPGVFLFGGMFSRFYVFLVVFFSCFYVFLVVFFSPCFYVFLVVFFPFLCIFGGIFSRFMYFWWYFFLFLFTMR